MSCFFARSTACTTPFISFLSSHISLQFNLFLDEFFPLFCGRALASQCCFGFSIWSSYAATHGDRFYELYGAACEGFFFVATTGGTICNGSFGSGLMVFFSEVQAWGVVTSHS